MRRTVTIMKPAVGPSKEAFSSAIGEFDSLVDTCYDERREQTFWVIGQDDDGDDYDTDEYDDENAVFGGSGVIELLRSRHNCHRYVWTTMLHALKKGGYKKYETDH